MFDEAEFGGSGGGAPRGGGATAVPDVGIIGNLLPGKVDCVKDRSRAVVHLRMMDWCDGSLVSVAVDGRSSRIGDDGREREREIPVVRRARAAVEPSEQHGAL